MSPAQEAAALVRIVDDEESVRQSLSFMLRQEGLVTRTFSSAEDFLSHDSPSIPGCVILDVRMPGMSGLELQEEMAHRGIRLPIIFLSAHGDIDMAVDVMSRGAVAFVQKSPDARRLLDAVYKALALDAGHSDLSDAEAIARWNELTDREKQVAELIAQGLLNREIGERLGGISFKTVQVHRGEVCRKLGVRRAAGITQAVRRIEALLKTPSGLTAGSRD